jgi:hypothetical protein
LNCTLVLWLLTAGSAAWGLRAPQSLDVVVSESETIVIGEAEITDVQAYKTCQWKDWGAINVEKVIFGGFRPGEKIRLKGWHWPCAEDTPDYWNIRGQKIWLLEGNSDGTFFAPYREYVRGIGDEEAVRDILGKKSTAERLAHLAEKKSRKETERQKESEDDEITLIMGGIGIGVVLLVAVLFVALQIRSRSVKRRGDQKHPRP